MQWSGWRSQSAGDVMLLLGLGVLILGAGLGLRDPWPADEPRFALAARDMVTSGEWLFPRIGGDLYPDKPPVFMWLIALCYALTGSLRVAFLMPSLLAGLGVLLLTYDITRRLWGREAGRWAALVLLFTVQFTVQAKRAQIDMVLVFWSTLSLYALLRYLLLGHGLRWWALGGFAAGLGVITKGVGFLPLLVLLPYAYARRAGWTLPAVAGGWRWAVAPAAFVGAIALWLVPMLIAAAGDPMLSAYRDEILFQQTAQRYVAAWHHHRPFYYYLTVMLSLWIPLIFLLPWLVPRWAERLRARDARVLLPLAWLLLVLLFFSGSPGKRGVYIFPALPALAILAGPWLWELARRASVQRWAFVFAAFLSAMSSAALVYFAWMAPERAAEIQGTTDLDLLLPLTVVTAIGVTALLVFRPARGMLASACVLGGTWLTVSLLVLTPINAERSGSGFIDQVMKKADARSDLGFLEYKEQFLLYVDRPITNFGHARWREGQRETYDAARWLNAARNRQLLVSEHRLRPCFAGAQSIEVGKASGDRWFLVQGLADDACAREGDASRAITYDPSL